MPGVPRLAALASLANRFIVWCCAMSEDGLLTGEDGLPRCWWAESAPEYRAYHDREWGFPVADDVRLFEKLSLEGFQAGLSWLTILRKREAFRPPSRASTTRALLASASATLPACSPMRASCVTAARSRL